MTARFAIEASNLADAEPTGIARYTRCLIEALATLAASGEADPDADFALTQVYKLARTPRRAAMLRGPGLAVQGWRGGVWPLREPRVDLLHVPDERMPPWRLPMVATIHDLYAALGINVDDEAKRQRKLAHYARLRDRCARLICISENTRRDFLEHVGGDPARLRVVHLGVGERFRPHGSDEIAPVLRRLGVEGPYLFFVGATANKNLARTLAAYAASAARRGHRLVVAGKLAPAMLADTRARIAALRLDERVQLLGYVDDADLPALYAGADAFLFPSLYEGYGLPILEAMASGTPVLAGDRASCTEVADGHAVIVDPEEVDAIAAGIDATIALDGAQRDAARAHASAQTWHRTARETLAIWREVAAER